jgi:hypothetical protein
MTTGNLKVALKYHQLTHVISEQIQKYAGICPHMYLHKHESVADEDSVQILETAL